MLQRVLHPRLKSLLSESNLAVRQVQAGDFKALGRNMLNRKTACDLASEGVHLTVREVQAGNRAGPRSGKPGFGISAQIWEVKQSDGNGSNLSDSLLCQL